MDTRLERKQRNLDINRELGRHLARLRCENRVSQAEVAEAMGFGRPLVSKIEHGQRELSVAELPDYARAIGSTSHEVINVLVGIVERYRQEE
ncbi:MAG: helix-turn-helix transcriptional regulator [Atopobiaceae bacterium]|nr:helix-turn-helix domain-containing protein [Olsenella sp.]MBQ6491500.1 helix-turn-helix transcriptional regulator [Atopobiaceae bacterium]